jgi:voltage-gated potassium channel Kch
VIATSVVVTVFATAVVIVGGSLIWLLERNITSATFRSWGDAVWWALTTLTTVGYGDHVPVTVAGREQDQAAVGLLRDEEVITESVSEGVKRAASSSRRRWRTSAQR